MIQQARVRRQVRPRRAADRLLIDHHKSLDPVEAFGDLAAERLDRRFETIVIVAGLLALAQSVGDGVHKELSLSGSTCPSPRFR